MPLTRTLAAGCTVLICATGCAFQGVNSLPLPGAVGNGKGAMTYHVQLANVGTLESNSPVMINDVVVGSVRDISIKDRHAQVDVVVERDALVPANAVATVGQTSLLGSMHLQLGPPLGEPATGRLPTTQPSRWTVRRHTRPPNGRSPRWLPWSTVAAWVRSER